MRSVSLFLPPGLRTSGKPHGPSNTKVGPAPRRESGIGIVLDHSEDGRLVVEHVWPGSPAAVTGIQQGDVLLLIDGMQGSVSSVDVARDLICGAEGSIVTLQVLRGITQLEFGPITRVPWVTMQQMDGHLAKLRKIGQDGRHSGCVDIYNNLLRLKQEIEEERKAFQDAVMHAKQCERQGKLRARQLELALIEVTEASKLATQEAEKRAREHEDKIAEASQAMALVCAESEAAQKRLQQLEGDFIRVQQKVGNSDVQISEFEQRAVKMLNSYEPLEFATPRSRLSAFTLKHLSSYSMPKKTPSVSSMSTEEAGGGEGGPENVKEQLRDIFGEQAHRLRNALRSHHTFSTEVEFVYTQCDAYIYILIDID